jgi:hypothetical protein
MCSRYNKNETIEVIMAKKVAKKKVAAKKVAKKKVAAKKK